MTAVTFAAECGYPSSQVGYDWTSDAANERAASSLFRRLDNAGTGRVDEATVLSLWPALAKFVDGSNAATIAAQLQKQVIPLSRDEWMTLMGALRAITGPRRFRSTMRAAEALLAELRAGPHMTQHADQSRSPRIPLPGAVLEVPSFIAPSTAAVLEAPIQTVTSFRGNVAAYAETQRPPQARQKSKEAADRRNSKEVVKEQLEQLRQQHEAAANKKDEELKALTLQRDAQMNGLVDAKTSEIAQLQLQLSELQRGSGDQSQEVKLEEQIRQEEREKLRLMKEEAAKQLADVMSMSAARDAELNALVAEKDAELAKLKEQLLTVRADASEAGLVESPPASRGQNRPLQLDTADILKTEIEEVRRKTEEDAAIRNKAEIDEVRRKTEEDVVMRKDVEVKTLMESKDAEIQTVQDEIARLEAKIRDASKGRAEGAVGAAVVEELEEQIRKEEALKRLEAEEQARADERAKWKVAEGKAQRKVEDILAQTASRDAEFNTLVSAKDNEIQMLKELIQDVARKSGVDLEVSTLKVQRDAAILESFEAKVAAVIKIKSHAVDQAGDKPSVSPEEENARNAALEDIMQMGKAKDDLVSELLSDMSPAGVLRGEIQDIKSIAKFGLSPEESKEMSALMSACQPRRMSRQSTAPLQGLEAEENAGGQNDIQLSDIYNTLTTANADGRLRSAMQEVAPVQGLEAPDEWLSETNFPTPWHRGVSLDLHGSSPTSVNRGNAYHALVTAMDDGTLVGSMIDAIQTDANSMSKLKAMSAERNKKLHRLFFGLDKELMQVQADISKQDEAASEERRNALEQIKKDEGVKRKALEDKLEGIPEVMEKIRAEEEAKRKALEEILRAEEEAKRKQIEEDNMSKVQELMEMTAARDTELNALVAAKDEEIAKLKGATSDTARLKIAEDGVRAEEAIKREALEKQLAAQAAEHLRHAEAKAELERQHAERDAELKSLTESRDMEMGTLRERIAQFEQGGSNDDATADKLKFLENQLRAEEAAKREELEKVVRAEEEEKRKQVDVEAMKKIEDMIALTSSRDTELNVLVASKDTEIAKLQERLAAVQSQPTEPSPSLESSELPAEESRELPVVQSQPTDQAKDDEIKKLRAEIDEACAARDAEAKKAKLLQELQVSTNCPDGAAAGSCEIQVDSIAGFNVGDTVKIADQHKSEINQITAFASIILKTPLVNSYEAGATIVKIDDDSKHKQMEQVIRMEEEQKRQELEEKVKAAEHEHHHWRDLASTKESEMATLQERLEEQIRHKEEAEQEKQNEFVRRQKAEKQARKATAELEQVQKQKHGKVSDAADEGDDDDDGTEYTYHAGKLVQREKQKSKRSNRAGSVQLTAAERNMPGRDVGYGDDGVPVSPVMSLREPSVADLIGGNLAEFADSDSGSESDSGGAGGVVGSELVVGNTAPDKDVRTYADKVETEATVDRYRALLKERQESNQAASKKAANARSQNPSQTAVDSSDPTPPPPAAVPSPPKHVSRPSSSSEKKQTEKEKRTTSTTSLPELVPKPDSEPAMAQDSFADRQSGSKKMSQSTPDLYALLKQEENMHQKTAGRVHHLERQLEHAELALRRNKDPKKRFGVNTASAYKGAPGNPADLPKVTSPKHNRSVVLPALRSLPCRQQRPHSATQSREEATILQEAREVQDPEVLRRMTKHGRSMARAETAAKLDKYGHNTWDLRRIEKTSKLQALDSFGSAMWDSFFGWKESTEAVD